MGPQDQFFGLLDMVSVEELHIYPLKSARGIAKSAVRLAATGFEWDRNWMITDSAGGFLSQRTDPHLARIETHLEATGLTLRAPGLPALELPFILQGEVVSVQVWKDRCEGIDQGQAAFGEQTGLQLVDARPHHANRRRFVALRAAWIDDELHA